MSGNHPRIRQLKQVLMQGAGGAETLNELAELSLGAGDIDGAIDAYAKCLTLVPRNAGIRNNLGAALIRARRFDEAMTTLQSVLIQQPGHPRALVNLGKALRELGRHAEAVGRLREALTRAPTHLPAWLNLADAEAARGDFVAAEQALAQVLTLAPTSVEAHSALGMIHLRQGRDEAAVEWLRTAVRMSPAHADAHSHLAHALFVLGDWPSAWPHFEFRFQRTAHRVHLDTPAGMTRWNGDDSPTTSLLVVGEQGMGDQIQFARYAAVLRERGNRVTLACHAALVRLLTDAGIADEVVALKTFESRQPRSPSAWYPLMSLAAWHGTTPRTVPRPEGYLRADPERIARWSLRIPRPGFRVAIAWSGNPAMETGQHAGRSPPLSAFAPLLEVPGIRLISVQKGAGTEQLTSGPFGDRVLQLDDLDAGPDAFLDTAAVLHAVDAVVTSDTSIAHLAGALGVPTLICLSYEPDWRWMRHGGTTPWYDTARLFRQAAAGEWGEVFDNVARYLHRASGDARSA